VAEHHSVGPVIDMGQAGALCLGQVFEVAASPGGAQRSQIAGDHRPPLIRLLRPPLLEPRVPRGAA